MAQLTNLLSLVLAQAKEKKMSELAIDEHNAQLVNTFISEQTLDLLFAHSANLSVAAVNDFILQLCRVSRMEISGYGGGVGSSTNVVTTTNDPASSNLFMARRSTFFGSGGVSVASKAIGHQPVIYSLQKLVEVAHYNMDVRGRVAWDQLWGVMSAHFTSTALHSNAAVGMYAVDSLRQLSIKFLQKVRWERSASEAAYQGGA
jgi:brefeldin A-inhibited guanine nucleotide-exchange protein